MNRTHNVYHREDRGHRDIVFSSSARWFATAFRLEDDADDDVDDEDELDDDDGDGEEDEEDDEDVPETWQV